MIKANDVKLGFVNPDVQDYSVILDYYGGTRINSYRTSSVPFAQYWKDYPRRLLEIEHQTGLSLLHPQIHFEYATESLGNANASMSDVMILADGVRIAIEAKFTEFAKNGFQTIGGWLSTGNKENRRRVLDHWVNMIIPYSESDLTNIEDIPYHFLHLLRVHATSTLNMQSCCTNCSLTMKPDLLLIRCSTSLLRPKIKSIQKAI